MAKRFPGKRLIWLLPLVIAAGLLLAVLVAALAIRLAGWHWQGPGWRDGLTLDAIWQETDGCRPLEARGVRLSALRPLTLGIDTLGIHACPDDADTASDGLTDIPSLPALEVTVWAVQYRDLPPVMVNLSQRDGAWRARAEFRDSRLRAEYRRSSGRWRVDGTLQGGHLDQRLAGEVRVQGDGLWWPGDWTDPEHFTGELVLLGRDLGLETPGPRGNVTVRGQWQGDAWRLRAGSGGRRLGGEPRRGPAGPWRRRGAGAGGRPLGGQRPPGAGGSVVEQRRGAAGRRAGQPVAQRGA